MLKSPTLQDNIKISYISNFIILMLVVVMMLIYYFIGAKLLAYYSVFVTLVYLLNFLFIYKMWLRLFIWSTYTMLTLYMAICTVMLGYNYGFHLYVMSTIPMIYYIKYISWEYNLKNPCPIFWTIVLSLSCIISSLFTVRHGSYYNITGFAPYIFLGINIASVTFFLFVFSARMIKLVINSKTKLQIQANYDALTGLANRYCVRNSLESTIACTNPNENIWLSIIDIDNFKKINDTYGHNSGDKVLVTLSNLMKDICTNCTIGRWGGEEFIISAIDEETKSSVLEELRKKVEETEVQLENEKIHFTITGGVSRKLPGQKIDNWISDADHKLYEGKTSGKNKIVF